MKSHKPVPGTSPPATAPTYPPSPVFSVLQAPQPTGKIAATVEELKRVFRHGIPEEATGQKTEIPFV